MSEEAPPSAPRKRPHFEPIGFGSTLRSGGLILYGALVAAMAGIAGYNYAVQGQPAASVYVAGPTIGALWFGLRLFMIMGSRK
ncbi:MAG: hypothetical protein ABL883_05230 [Terricaulis sp.]